MLFSSSIFLFLFLPIVLIGYYVLPKKLRNIWLLITSLVFYAWGEPNFVFVLMASILLNYVFGLIIDRVRTNKKISKLVLALMVTLNLGLLFVYKYLGFAIDNLNAIFGNVLPVVEIVLPIGISFFTFQAMSYVIDVYRGNGEVQKNPLNVGLYIALFPQLVAGPIVRYQTVADEIKNRKETLDDFSDGVKRFIAGLAKKVMLADILSMVSDVAYSANAAGDGSLSVSFAWLGAICYAFQLFFDFAGYSDMAIGMGKMFGFHFLENFNYPYISASVSELWKRWHISLGTWFRDYLYFPLGGSRVKTKSRLIFNFFVVWSLTGLWHGASWNYITWGLMYFVLLTFEKLTGIPGRFKNKWAKAGYRVFTLLAFLLGLVFVRANNMTEAFRYIATLFGFTSNVLHTAYTTYILKNNLVLLIFAVLLSTPVFKILREKCAEKPMLEKMAKIVVPIVYLAMFFVSTSWLVIGTHHPFIYFNF